MNEAVIRQGDALELQAMSERKCLHNDTESQGYCVYAPSSTCPCGCLACIARKQRLRDMVEYGPNFTAAEFGRVFK